LAPPIRPGDQRQLVLARQLLRAQRLLQAHRRHGAALDGAVAGRDQHALAGDHADADDAAAALHALLAVVVVHAQPASGLSSRNSLPRSSSRATRSRGSSWPRCSKSRLARRFGHHLGSSARTSARRSAMRARWRRRRATRVEQRAEHRHHFSTSGVTARWKPSKGCERLCVLPRREARCPATRAVDLQRDAGDEGRRRREQEDDGAADLGLDAQAAQRHMVLQLLGISCCIAPP
jgi:hypothetical protein